MCLKLTNPIQYCPEPVECYVVKRVDKSGQIVSAFNPWHWELGVKQEKPTNPNVAKIWCGEDIGVGYFHTFSSRKQAIDYVKYAKKLNHWEYGNLVVFKAIGGGLQCIGTLYRFADGYEKEIGWAFTELTLIERLELND